jgi:predicted lipid carrier protein YhbT
MEHKQQDNYSAPLSSAFILGLLAKPVLCRPLLQQAINKLVQMFSDLHPNVINRMAEFTPAIIILNPIDMPFSFLVEFTANNMNILIIDDQHYTGDDITKISATLSFFLNMLEGELDGDALFFSRQLIIEGDTTIIVALRNILEAENIDINKDINDKSTLLANIIKFVKNTARAVSSYLDNDLAKIKESIISDNQAEIKLTSSKQQVIQDEIKKLQKQQIAMDNKLKSMRLKINKG